MKVDEIYQQKCAEPSDINELLPLLRDFALRCAYVTEFGVRSMVSTWALLAAKPRKLVSYDLTSPGPEAIALATEAAMENATRFYFIQGDTREVNIQQTDMLFIDTFHVYQQLKIELERHAGKVYRYIAMHDTETFGEKGEAGEEKGLNFAIREFLDAHHEWYVVFRTGINNGLTVLERKL